MKRAGRSSQVGDIDERGGVSSASFTRAPERRPKKEANPASLRSVAPSKGRGLRGYSLLPMEGGAPKGRRLDGDGGMKKSEEIVSSTPLTRAPYPPLTRSLFPNGEGCDTRTTLSSTQSLPLEGKANRTGAKRPITICGEAAAITHNPEPLNPEPLHLSTTLYICIK